MPQVQRKGTKAGELIISELSKDGWFSQAAWIRTDAGNGRRYNRGFTADSPDARQALNTFI
jgi:hypothetical protein